MPKPTKASHAARRSLHAALDTAVATIAMMLGVRLLPGIRWVHAYTTRTCLYPFSELLTTSLDIGIMRLWQAASHVVNTTGDLDLYDVLVDTVLEIAEEVGARTTRPDWLMPAVAAAERQRAERIARHLGRSLAQRQLPNRGTSFRAGDRAEDLKSLSRPVEREVDFWNVVTTAVEGLASGTLDDGDLAGNGLRWNPSLTEAIRGTSAIPSYDALIEAMQPILMEIAIERAKDLAEAGETPDLEADAGEGGSEPADPVDGERSGHPEEEGAGEGSAAQPGAGEDPTSSSDGSQTGTKPITITIDAKTLDRIRQELENGDPGRVDIDYTPGSLVILIPGGKPDATREADEVTAAIIVVPTSDLLWDTVSRANTHIAGPIEHVISQYLTENEIGDVKRGTRSGRLDLRAIARPPGSTSPPFMRRADPSDHSYDVVLVVDRSGSMGTPTGNQEDPVVFGGSAGMRWHLALRLEIGLVEALAHLPGTRTAVITYDDTINLVKTFDAKLSDDVKHDIVQKTIAKGNNDDAGALALAIEQFRSSEADRKLIFYLTDGEFCSDRKSVQRILARCVADEIEMVFLTIGRTADQIRSFVPAHLADEITEDTVARVLARHIARMLGLVIV